MIRNLFAIEASDTPCTLIAGRTRHIETVPLQTIFNHEARLTLGDMLRMGFNKNIWGFHRNACASCMACQPIRLRADLFNPGKTQRHIINSNADLTIELAARPDENEHYRLYSSHQRARFPARLGSQEREVIRGLIGNKTFPARILEFRLNDHLVGAMIHDVLDDGISAISSYYDVSLSKERSLGTFMVLEMARRLKESGKPHLYLGTWSNEPTPYSYKSRFQPAEVMNRDGQWRPLT